MLIIKDGISREIDEKNLQEYLDKGYKLIKPIEQRKPKKPVKE